MKPSTRPGASPTARTFHSAIAIVSLIGCLLPTFSAQARPVDVARNQALAKRAQANAASVAAWNAYNTARPGHVANIANLRTRGSNAWATLMTKDPSDPGFANAQTLLNMAAMELDEADTLLSTIPNILNSGDRYRGLGDGKMAQGDANMMVGNFRVAIYCYWAAKDWYRQAITIFGRAQNRLTQITNLINSAQANIAAAEVIIAGLPAMPVMPPMPAPGPAPGPGPMPMPGTLPTGGPGVSPGPGTMPGMP